MNKGRIYCIKLWGQMIQHKHVCSHDLAMANGHPSLELNSEIADAFCAIQMKTQSQSETAGFLPTNGTLLALRHPRD